MLGNSRFCANNTLRHHFENDDGPTQDQFGSLIDSTLSVVGGPQVLTNRPPPVPDLRFVGKSNEVVLAADFSPLQATSVRVELWKNGTMIASGAKPENSGGWRFTNRHPHFRDTSLGDFHRRRHGALAGITEQPCHPSSVASRPSAVKS